MKRGQLLLVCGLLCSLISLLASAGEPLPNDSIYRLTAQFSDQNGQQFQLADKRGQPLLVSMFYTSCQYVCPLIIDSAKGVEHGLSESERAQLGILLVSMDPVRDDTEALASVAAKRKLDASRWSLARTGKSDVRKLAALLGVRYRELADGEFNHTSALVLLDADGRKLASTERLGTNPDPEFIAVLRGALAAARRDAGAPDQARQPSHLRLPPAVLDSDQRPTSRRRPH
jgi:protein SCO1/2